MSQGSDCLFCRIVSRELPSEIVYQDEDVTAFKDIQPAAPVHILVVPNTHIASLAEAREEHAGLLGRLLVAFARVAEAEGLAEAGYRLVANTGKDAGQVVPHLHFHLLGGRSLGWPPG